MSREGNATRSPPTPRSEDSAASPPEMSEISVDVPPISKGIRSGTPSNSAERRAPATPPAGPESTVPAARRIVSATGATPPCERIISTGPL